MRIAVNRNKNDNVSFPTLEFVNTVNHSRNWKGFPSGEISCLRGQLHYWLSSGSERLVQEDSPASGEGTKRGFTRLLPHNLSEFESYHLVYIDESGCDKRIGYRRTGWAPLGVTLVQVAKFHRGQ
jgi:hypothetical protein